MNNPNLHPLLAERWSPLAFSPEPIAPATLELLMEAARWAPSSFNEQPWRYIYATIDEAPAHAQLLSCLVPGNQEWAQNAPFLAISVAKLTFTRTGKPNPYGWHDVGQATMSIVVEARAHGLQAHQMGGILPDRIRELYAIPADFAPVAGLAIGRYGDPLLLSPALQTREAGPRTRHPASELFFPNRFQ
jgi:nitroreductase